MLAGRIFRGEAARRRALHTNFIKKNRKTEHVFFSVVYRMNRGEQPACPTLTKKTRTEQLEFGLQDEQGRSHHHRAMPIQT